LRSAPSDPSQKDEDDDDQQHRADRPARAVSPAAAVGPRRDHASHHQDQDDQENRAQHPGAPPGGCKSTSRASAPQHRKSARGLAKAFLTTYGRTYTEDGLAGGSREAGTATRLARRLLDPPRMDFTLKPLPYSKNALEPALGRETVTLHYEKHHAGYLHKLKKLLDDKPEASESLEWIICASHGPVFDNAAQVCNHDFYWRSMRPAVRGAHHTPLRTRAA